MCFTTATTPAVTVPAYTSSIPFTNFELCKNVYDNIAITTTTSIITNTAIVRNNLVGNISTYLKPSNNSSHGLDVYINFANRLILNKDEWRAIFMENAEDITDFFRSGSPPPSAPSSDKEDKCVYYINIPEYNGNFIVIHASGGQWMSICFEDWCYLEPIMDYLNLRLKQLYRVKFFYENRMNYFRKKFKLNQVQTLYEASVLLDKICDETSLVDMEIRCFAVEYLFYSCYLS